MESHILDVLADRVLELGPKPAAGGPYRHFKLTRDADGVAWLLFDREGAGANTLSADVLTEFDAVLAEGRGAAAAIDTISDSLPFAIGVGADRGNQSRALDAILRACLFDVQHGHAQIAVVGQRQFDQFLQTRVVEKFAPADVGDGVG